MRHVAAELRDIVGLLRKARQAAAAAVQQQGAAARHQAAVMAAWGGLGAHHGVA